MTLIRVDVALAALAAPVIVVFGMVSILDFDVALNMKKSLLIRMEIPIDPPLIFARWFPLDEDKFVTVKQDDIEIKFWFDLSCTSPKTRDELNKWTAVRANKIFADATISGLEDQLVEHIRHRVYSRKPTPDELELQKEYRQFENLGKKVYEVVLTHLNRLLVYVRAVPGQFWLQEHIVDPNIMASDFTKFNAKATIDGQNWFRWLATQSVTFIIAAEDQSRFLSENDWSQASQFVNSSRKTPLIWELLAGADFSLVVVTHEVR